MARGASDGSSGLRDARSADRGVPGAPAVSASAQLPEPLSGTLGSALVRAVVPAAGPIGALTIGRTTAGLALVVFGDRPEAVDRAAARLGTRVVDGDAGPIAQQLAEYLAGARRAFDVALDWSLTTGSPRRVLQVLHATVPFGTTVTYGELAARSGLGRAHTAARGTGAIMGSNPLPVVVPCHRVLATDGLGGFGAGRAVKEWLLALEGVLTPALDLWPQGR